MGSTALAALPDATTRSDDRPISLSVLLLSPLIAAADGLGIDVAAALERVALPRTLLGDVAARIDRTVAERFLNELAYHAKPHVLGLVAAQRLTTGDLGVLDFLMGSAATLGGAAENAARYFGLLHDAATFTCVVTEGEAEYALATSTAAPVAPVWAEFGIAAVVQIGRRVTGREVRPSEVHFVHPRRSRRGDFERHFGCPVRFGQRKNAFTFPAMYLEFPTERADRALCETLEGCAQQMLRAPKRPRSLRHDVCHALTQRLGRADLSLEAVASELGTTGRTLQRRLRARGSSFHRELEALRRDHALSLAAAHDLPVRAIAEQLGYDDASAFTRAFRRWTGTSPVSYLRSHTPGTPRPPKTST